jgi:hypothetical protein
VFPGLYALVNIVSRFSTTNSKHIVQVCVEATEQPNLMQQSKSISMILTRQSKSNSLNSMQKSKANSVRQFVPTVDEIMTHKNSQKN